MVTKLKNRIWTRATIGVLALALIVGSGLAAYEGAISTLAALGLLLLAGVACLVVAVVEARLEERG